MPFYTSFTSFSKLRHLFRLQLCPVTPASEHHVVCLVDEPVKYPLGQHGIGEKGVPVFGRAVAGEHHGADMTALIDQFIEVLSLLQGKFFHGEVVDEQQIGLQIAS